MIKKNLFLKCEYIYIKNFLVVQILSILLFQSQTSIVKISNC